MKLSRVLWLAVLCLGSWLSTPAQADLGPRLNDSSASAQLTISANVTDAAQVAFALPTESDADTADNAHHVTALTANSFALDLDAARTDHAEPTAAGLQIEKRRGGWWYSLPVTLTVRSVGLAESAAPFAVRLATSDADANAAPPAETFIVPAGETTITPRLGFFLSEADDRKPVKIRLIYQALLP